VESIRNKLSEDKIKTNWSPWMISNGNRRMLEMTVKELRELLKDYPDDTSVFVLRERSPYGTGGTLMNVEISWVIDQNTNKGSVCLSPREGCCEVDKEIF
jgi:hypothetical protein